MDTTREEIDEVTEHQASAPAEIQPFGNPVLAAMFKGLFYVFPMFPRELRVISAIMQNISSGLYAKFNQGHKVDWIDCYNFFIILELSTYIACTDNDCEKLRYMEEIDENIKDPGLGDLTGFDTINQHAQELAKAVEQLTLVNSIQREALREFIKEFFKMVEHWIEDRLSEQIAQYRPSTPESPNVPEQSPAVRGSIKRLFPDCGFIGVSQATGRRAW